jgi:hypothetical protein
MRRDGTSPPNVVYLDCNSKPRMPGHRAAWPRKPYFRIPHAPRCGTIITPE